MQPKNNKFAQLLTLLPEEESKLLIEQLSETEKKELSNDLQHLKPLNEIEKKELLEEAHSLLFFPSTTSANYLQKQLKEGNKPDEITKFISEEKPATTALLLSFLPVKKASHLFRHMNRTQREAVFESLIELSHTKVPFDDSVKTCMRQKWGSSSKDSVNENAQALIESILHTLPKLQIDPLITKFAPKSKQTQELLLGNK